MRPPVAPARGLRGPREEREGATGLMEPTWLAYFAGVISARAHIVLLDRGPRLRVTTRRTDILEWLAARTGTTVRIDTGGYQRRPCSKHCTEHHEHLIRQSGYWNVDGARATIVLAATRPYWAVETPDLVEALRYGFLKYPPEKGDVVRQMVLLGWPVPEVATVTASAPA